MTDFELLLLLHRADGEYRRQLHNAMVQSGGGKNKGHGRILHELARCDGMTQKELAERLDIRPQSLTDALVRIENLGYITRTRSEKDRREQVVHITASGRERSEMFHKTSAEITQRLFSNLTDEEKETLASLLAKITSDSEDVRKDD